MKSKHPDRSLQTSCKECAFAAYEGDTQVGCNANRLDQLRKGEYVVEAYDDDKEFYVIDCLCNMFRAPSWNGGTGDVNKARDEILPKVCIMVSMDGVDNKSYQQTLKSIKSLDYDSENIYIIISQTLSSTPEQKKIATNFFTTLLSLGINSDVVVSVAPKMREYDAFKRAGGATHHTKIEIGDELPADIFNQIDTALNDKLERCVFFDYAGVSVIGFHVFLSRYNDYSSYEEFRSEIKKESKEGNLYLELFK